MSVLSERLKKAREMKSKELRRKLTQVMVFHDTGVHDKTLGGYENGVSEPDIETLTALANYYGVTVDWLSGNTDSPVSASEENKHNSGAETTLRLVEEHAQRMGLSVSDPTFQKLLADALDLLRIARQQNNE